MKQIVITINVPDGVAVQVNGNAQQGQPARAFTPRPDPEYPGGVCPLHGEDWKLIPAGYSKTKRDENGQPKRYNAFWTCPIRDCTEKPEKPSAVEDVTYGGGYEPEPQLPF